MLLPFICRFHTIEEKEGEKLNSKNRVKQGLKQWLDALPFVGIGLALMGLFTVYPLIRNIQMSVSEYNIVSNTIGEFQGLNNYLRMFSDSEWMHSLGNTLLYTLVTVPGQMFLGLLLAVMVNSVTKGRTLFKVILYLPVITSWVVAGLAFRYIFASGNGGIINYALMQLHLINSPIAWLQSEATANIVLCLFGIWKGAGFTMVIYLGGVQNVSSSLYEAASIDGAGSIAKFFKITIPMVKNTTLYLLTILTIGGFSAYIHVMMITKGAPLGKTNQLMNYMYETAFTDFDFSYASAQAVFIGLVVFCISIIQRRITKETVN